MTLDVHTFYRLAVWLPLALPVVVALIVHGLDLAVPRGRLQDIVEILLYSLVYGGIPYGALALWATWWIGGRREQDIKRLMYRAPLLMAAVFVPVALITGFIVGAPGPFAAVAVLGALVSIAVGYVYVFFVMLMRDELPTTQA